MALVDDDLVRPTGRQFRDAALADRLHHLARLRDTPGLPLFDEPIVPGLPHGSGYRALTRYADVTDAVRRPADFCSSLGVLWINDLPADFNEFFGSVINMDDPRHSRLRGIVATAFTPRTLRTLRGDIHRAATDTVRAAATRGDFDIVADLATPFTLNVICDLLGVPQSHRADLLAASTTIVSGGDPDLIPHGQDPVRAVLDAGSYLATLATDLADHRRRHPTDDLLTTLVHAEVDGQRLTTTELASFFTLLAFAGQETTRNAIALGLWALYTHADARAAWGADYDRLAPTAVEEIIRYTSPVVFMRRTATRDTILAGHQFTTGDKIALYFAAANHDPAIFTNPDQLDLTRSTNPHLGFGGPGPHHCLGAHLARAEITAIFREIFRQIPGLTITGEPEHLRSTSVNALKHLPASITPKLG
ncbi:MAG: cytochrome P450 [Frankia sp.]